MSSTELSPSGTRRLGTSVSPRPPGSLSRRGRSQSLRKRVLTVAEQAHSEVEEHTVWLKNMKRHFLKIFENHQYNFLLKYNFFAMFHI